MNDHNLQIAGFKAAAVKGGIRGKDRLDIALIFCEKPAVSAAVFTRSLVKAAPVLLDMERMQNGEAQAILINSGIANACTGEPGMVAARFTSSLAAKELGVAEDLVLISSTGVIGMQLDLSCFEKAIPELVASLSAHGFADVAQAIMTTDTVPKISKRQVKIGGQQVNLLGLAKGAGMIKPNMATMLCFIMTDLAVSAELLQQMLAAGVEKSFNAISVDGDTSTNDTVLLLASGFAGNQPLMAGSPEVSAFQVVLDDLMKDLALQIVRDGEGATKLITIRVSGALTEDEARLAAETVAESKLVKTAFFGEDANWGRIIAALGRSGASFNPDLVDISFDDVLMVENGLGQGKDAETLATKVLKQKEFAVNLDLKAGAASFVCYTCDLSIDYVKINADYRS
ncbi:MAG: bifunctional glutamate N-acetyltransferase/amino-acid acetyltransferase ArgJ [Proteobacteria bacterium]|nr:bifunctional glutamate N-acetyltransferase/amino-acid acetyltransferase ArgJ [Pseudomonadota bacterium]MBU1715897.1 bifunctional glutamate N-acetyltransferase/amino-acid acetyltransferase ArgJ [Pseudomonadota bacterium]